MKDSDDLDAILEMIRSQFIDAASFWDLGSHIHQTRSEDGVSRILTLYEMKFIKKALLILSGNLKFVFENTKLGHTKTFFNQMSKLIEMTSIL